MGAGTPDRVNYQAKKETSENLFSPPNLRNTYREANRTEKVEFLCHKKMISSPRINEEIKHAYNLYEHTKKSFVYLGAVLSLTEWFLLKVWAVVMVTLFLPPIADMTYYLMKKVKILDDLVCHQLEFIEAKLKTIDTSIIYRPGGVLDRILLAIRLCVRLTFFFPRITWRMTNACFSEIKKEIIDSVDISFKIFLPELPRRSKRNPKLQTSPGKKRKHEEPESTEAYPEYLVCVPNYCEDADPDYEPNSDADTEVTSASENSHDESDDGLDESEDTPVSKSPLKQMDKNDVLPCVDNNTNIIIS